MIHIHQNNSWQRCNNLAVFKEGHWQHIKAIFEYNEGQWQRIFSYQFVIEINEPTIDFKLQAALAKTDWAGDAAYVMVIVNTPLGASNTNAYAFDTTGVPNNIELNIINNNFIVGAGGKGGNAPSASGGSIIKGSDGERGGGAILLTVPTRINNLNGIIAGGGGGGASSYTVNNKPPGGGNGGGGGAGLNPGAGGAMPSGSKIGEPGQTGKMDAGGSSGKFDIYVVLKRPDNGYNNLIGVGGNGGDLGQAGQNSDNYRELMGYQYFAKGGAAGAAIIGAQHIKQFIGNSNHRLRGKIL